MVLSTRQRYIRPMANGVPALFANGALAGYTRETQRLRRHFALPLV